MTPAEIQTKKWRRILVYSSTTVILVGSSLYLLWALSQLILPILVGALAAYLCRPLLTSMKKKGLSHGLSILSLFMIFLGTVVGLTFLALSMIPDDKGKLELRVRIQYKLEQKYDEYMGLNDPDPTKKGNFLYQVIGKDLQPSFHNLVNSIMLDPQERILFEHYYDEAFDENSNASKYYDYYLENIRNDQKRLGKNFLTNPDSAAANKDETSNTLETITSILSLWIAAPFVFLFLLLDEGEIKKSLVQPVPNRYFEMALTIIDNVDEAIGAYLRGTLLECALVGLTFAFCLILIGFDIQIALIIGIVAGLSNAIPFLGPAIGLVVGVAYALIMESIHPLIPGVTLDNAIVYVMITVAIAQGLDNAVFQPIILGSAVSLHALVVIIGVMAGSMLMGFAGMLFAIPAIVVLKVIFTTFFDQMKAYHIL